MNPGNAKTQKACAIRCIAGGIPPMLLQCSQPPRYYLLTGLDGKAINGEVLDFVAEPVSITGNLRRHNETMVLEIDPITIQRLDSL